MLYYDTIIKYKVRVTLTQPLHVGGSDGDRSEILVDPISGIPFVQASSIAGALRSYYETKYGEAAAGELFGSSNGKAQDGSSRFRISDAFVEISDKERVKLEYRPRVKISEVYGTVSSSKLKGVDASSGHKFEMLYVGVGANLSFECYVFLKSDDADTLETRMKELFSAMEFGEIRLGGQQSNGCGYLSISFLGIIRFNLKSDEDIARWMDEAELSEDQYTDILPELSDTPSDDFVITLSGQTEGDLLIRGTEISDFGKGAPDAVNIKNANGEYVIPGSSFKGAMRSQMTRIATYLNPQKAKSIIEDTFGTTGNEKKESRAGNIFFRDTVVGDAKCNDNRPLRNRIHVDKFTGGVIHGGNFTEKNVAGDVKFVVRIKNKNNPERSAGLLLLAMRDLSIGMTTLGSGFNVGKGFISVSDIEVKRGEKHAMIYPKENKIDDRDQLIDTCLKAVKGE